MKSSTINKAEIDKFTKISEEWWNPKGKFKPLHKFNPIRIKYIRDSLIKKYRIKNKIKPLNKLKVLDIGCGGGLLTEPISRLGADVTGIDASEKNIKIAKMHLKKSKLKIKYFVGSPEDFNFKNKFDVVLNMEIVEHVNNIDLFIKQSSFFLKKSGVMFIATINKTLKSYVFAIVGAEYILRWLPIGTHDWEKFIEPDKLIKIVEKYSLNLNKINGVVFNPIKNDREVSDNMSVNYITEFYKS